MLSFTILPTLLLTIARLKSWEERCVRGKRNAACFLKTNTYNLDPNLITSQSRCRDDVTADEIHAKQLSTSRRNVISRPFVRRAPRTSIGNDLSVRPRVRLPLGFAPRGREQISVIARRSLITSISRGNCVSRYICAALVLALALSTWSSLWTPFRPVRPVRPASSPLPRGRQFYLISANYVLL